MSKGSEPAYPIEVCPNGETAFGLTKREAFAMAAMQGLLAAPMTVRDVDGQAVKFADFVLAELDRTEESDDD